MHNKENGLWVMLHINTIIIASHPNPNPIIIILSFHYQRRRRIVKL